jgi:hypothetical protein
MPKPALRALENPMSVAYPLHLEREIGRRWLHRFVPTHHAIPLDRPKHPNDIRPLPRSTKRADGPAAESELSTKATAMNRSLVTGNAAGI